MGRRRGLWIFYIAVHRVWLTASQVQPSKVGPSAAQTARMSYSARLNHDPRKMTAWRLQARAQSHRGRRSTHGPQIRRDVPGMNSYPERIQRGNLRIHSVFREGVTPTKAPETASGGGGGGGGG